MVRAVLKVHSEGSIHVAQVVMVIQLSKGLIGQLRLAVEALEHVITWDTIRTNICDNVSVKDSNRQYTQPIHHPYVYRLTLEKVGYPYLIFCCCIHLHSFAAVKHVIMVMLRIVVVAVVVAVVMVMVMVMVMAMIMILSFMVTGLARQEISHQKNLSKFAKYKPLSFRLWM